MRLKTKVLRGLAHRNARNAVINQPGGGFRHAPRPARGANPAPLAGKGHQLLVAAPGAAQPQKPMGKDAAFEKRIELVFDKLRQARHAPGFDFGEERLEVSLHQAIQGRFLRPPPLVVDWACRGGAQRLLHGSTRFW